MRSGLRSKGALALLTVLVMAGCGGSSSGSTSQASATSPTSTSTAASTSATVASASTSTTTSETASSATSSSASEKGPTFEVTLSSSVKLQPIAKRYTCDGADTPPPVSWSKMPKGTAEIELFLFNIQPVHGKLVADWAVAGLKPQLRGLPAGRLPAGAIVGRNSYGHVGYTVCPPPGQEGHYAFLLYAVPKRLHVTTGFNTDALREKSLHLATVAGLLGANYKRA